jgi:hypothetical protein
MTQYPVVLDIVDEGDRIQVKATTSIERALESAEPLQGELRDIENDYEAALAGVRAALASAGKGRARDPRAYWLAGKCLAEFTEQLEARGFYLVGKNTTPARHLGISASSVWKMIAFYRRYPDPSSINTSIPWSAYRDNKVPRR